ncbi:hypothetical protein LTR78_009231 [Recurvomyces mirabilis]|uniref:Uncharacterized protein n=1 Tax=Recurvomyces mirabilis TaxID=574656 RepID=A0AAE0TST0_9PEZI|nr:hypothetical protein LTR78_009231 [Recurvomyces mirabilis]KAK5155609.1 hypothetical protein LTS14_005870 [Recurvomyces mirabilis]
MSSDQRDSTLNEEPPQYTAPPVEAKDEIEKPKPIPILLSLNSRKGGKKTHGDGRTYMSYSLDDKSLVRIIHEPIIVNLDCTFDELKTQVQKRMRHHFAKDKASDDSVWHFATLSVMIHSKRATLSDDSSWDAAKGLLKEDSEMRYDFVLDPEYKVLTKTESPAATAGTKKKKDGRCVVQ